MPDTGISDILDGLGIPREWIASRNLCRHDEAACLVVADHADDGRTFLLTPPAAAAWQKLKEAARADDVSLFLVSAFRSVDRQGEIVRRKLESGVALQNVLAVSAPPGFSEHHTGRAIDIGTPGMPLLEAGFDETPAYGWLLRRAAEFGFFLSYPRDNASGFDFEPWHWCFHDFPAARREDPDLPA